MLQKCHFASAAAAILCIIIFLLSTAVSELFMQTAHITAVKRAIASPGLFILVPAIALTGISGGILGKDRRGRLSSAKKKRMPFIAVNGLLVLIPAALFLSAKASAGEFDTSFYIIQILEICAGIFNLTLMIMNAKDGKKLKGASNA